MRRSVLLWVLVCVLSAGAAQAQFNLTEFFRDSDLEPLAHTKEVLLLVAQSADGAPGEDVNNFDDFFLINGVGRLVVEFNRELEKKGQTEIPGWIGVADYLQTEIPADKDIQAGFLLTREHFDLGDAPAGHVSVYKTINTQEIVYDYAVVQYAQEPRCQEYLYTPQTGDFQEGLQVSCRFSLSNFSSAEVISSGGKVGPME